MDGCFHPLSSRADGQLAWSGLVMGLGCTLDFCHTVGKVSDG